MKCLLQYGLASIVFFACTPNARADLITDLFNTGVIVNGVLAPGAAVELHYDLVSAPGGFVTAFVSNVIPASYQDNGPDSQWIGPDPLLDLDFPSDEPYVYRTTFTIPVGFDPTTAMITGLIASDDSVSILLNGLDTGAGLPGFTPDLTPFDVAGPLFQVGMNILEFVVTNAGDSPTGLRVEMTGTVSPRAIPEPSSLVGLATGLLVLGMRKSRCRGSRRRT
jgi:hypothetical protein